MNKDARGAFDGLRLVAAGAVLFSHSYPLLRQDASEPLFGNNSVRGFAVYAFFAISGYLVTLSWMRDPSPVRFMTRRMLRLIPALTFVTLVSFAIIGPLTTSLTLPAYFSNEHAWTFLSKVLIFPDQYGLPGVFKSNPFPDVINGSLWTLRLEFAFYLIVASLGYVGLLRWRGLHVAIIVFSLIMTVMLAQIASLNGIPFYRQIVALFTNAVPFFVGVALAYTNLSSKLLWVATAILLVATPALSATFLAEPLLILALPLAVILIARFCSCNLTRFGDYSYGIYLFAFPMQQCCIHFVPEITPVQLSIVAGLVTFACAFVSWHIIEKPALSFKPQGKWRPSHVPVRGVQGDLKGA